MFRAAWLILAFLLAAAPAFAADRIRFQFDWLPSGEQAALYLGIQQGVFAAEGLDVQITPGRGSADALAKLGAGAADLGIAGLSSLLTAKAEGPLPVTALLPIFSKQPDAVITTTTTGIGTLRDFAGKHIAAAPFSSSTPMWPVVLKANGVDPASVRVQKVDPVALAAMLAEGRVDGVLNWVNQASRVKSALEAAGQHVVVIPWSDFGFDGYGASLVASDRFLKDHPDVARRFVRAFLKAYRLAEVDPAAAAAALNALAPDVDADLSLAEWRATLPLIFNEVSDKDGFGVFEKGRLAKTWNWAAQAQGYDIKALDPETAVDRNFLPAP